MMENNYEYIKRLKLSMQSALLGAVSENMRSIAVDICGNKILLYFLLMDKFRMMIKRTSL